MNKETIAFRSGLIIPPNDYADSRILAATCNAELMHFGYMLSEEAFDALAKADGVYIIQLTESLTAWLQDMMGDGVWEPLHAGFPQTVMNTSIMSLYMDAIMHYWTRGEWKPDEQVANAGYQYEFVNYTIIEHGKEKDFMQIFTDLISVNAGITPEDLRKIKWFVANYDVTTHLPKSIPFKENLTLLAAEQVPVPVKTPTDVLRIAHYLSHGNSDLFIPSKMVKAQGWTRGYVKNKERRTRYFKKFSRLQRRYILSLLEQVANPSEMVNRRGQWLRLGEIIHPGEYKKRYPKAYAAFDKLRNTKVRSWKSYVNLAFKGGFEKGMKKLAERPGEFARLLDFLIRKGGEAFLTVILTLFRSIATKISSKVLWELYTHFSGRTVSTPRSVWIKGARKPTPLTTLVPMKEFIVNDILETIWGVFFDKFSLLEPLGSVWLDPELEKIPLPTNMKTVSDSLKVVIRGQRNKFTVDKQVIRLYMHWTNSDDLDLSSEFCTADGKKTGVCAFHSLGSQGIYSSGDVIPNRIGNHAEYIDIVLADFPYDYALLTINNFNGRPLNNTGLRVGFMERDHVKTEKAWYPKTVSQSMQITSPDVSVAAILFDLKNKEWILIDRQLSGIPVSSGLHIVNLMNEVAELPKVSALTLLKLHAEARGKIVAEPEDADILFKEEDFNTSYEQILKYML